MSSIITPSLSDRPTPISHTDFSHLINSRGATSKGSLGTGMRMPTRITGRIAATDTRPHKGGRDGLWLGIKPDLTPEFVNQYPYYDGSLVYCLYSDLELLP